MAYTSINWQTGDTITAARLNEMDPGWGIQETQLFSESVTTVAGEFGNEGTLTYGSQVTAPSITVTFDGADYQCRAITLTNSDYGYGGVNGDWTYDFTTYPFAFVSSTTDGNVFATETAGTYGVILRVPSLEISDGFRTAVNEAANNLSPLNVVVGSTTWQEVKDALDAGRVVCHQSGTNVDYVTSIQEFTISCIATSGTNVIVRTFFANDANSPLYAS